MNGIYYFHIFSNTIFPNLIGIAWCHSLINTGIEKTAACLLSQNSPWIVWWYCDIWIHSGLISQYSILWIPFLSSHEITHWAGARGCDGHFLFSIPMRTNLVEKTQKWKYCTSTYYKKTLNRIFWNLGCKEIIL